MTLKDDTIQINLHNIPNPHSEGMLIGHVVRREYRVGHRPDLAARADRAQSRRPLRSAMRLRKHNITDATIAGGHGTTAKQAESHGGAGGELGVAEARVDYLRPHPEERRKCASRRMGAAPCFETALTRLLSMRPTEAATDLTRILKPLALQAWIHRHIDECIDHQGARDDEQTPSHIPDFEPLRHGDQE